MADYWEQWEKHGVDWKAIFEALDPMLAAFAKRHKMAILPWRWEEPSRTLIWTSSGLKRSIRVVINGEPGGYVLDISGAIWRDDTIGESRTRSASSLELGQVTISKPEEMADQKTMSEFAVYFRKAYETVSVWTDLSHQIELSSL